MELGDDDARCGNSPLGLVSAEINRLSLPSSQREDESQVGNSSRFQLSKPRCRVGKKQGVSVSTNSVDLSTYSRNVSGVSHGQDVAQKMERN